MDKCKGDLNEFCYCCGQVKEADGRFNDEFKGLYTAYFDHPIIEDKWYVPTSCCRKCYSALADWKRSEGREQMKFGVPMLWSEPKAQKHDPDDCYACANDINRAYQSDFVYKSVESAKIPVAHSVAKVPYKYPSTPDSSEVSSNEDEEEEEESDSDDDYEPGTRIKKQPQRLNQTDMDFLAIRLKLDQEQIAFMHARFTKHNILLPGVVVPNIKKLKKITKRTKVDVVLEPLPKKARKQKATTSKVTATATTPAAKK